LGLAIITGGSRGLGAALCDLYRDQGWSVLEFSRSAPHDFSVELDLSDPVDASAVFSEAFASLGDFAASEIIAINNAGMLEPVGPVEHVSPGAIATNLDVNVLSAILFARAFVEAFQDHDCPKTFVNISSGAANKGYAGWSLYCAGKAAMENYTRSIALEQSARPNLIRAISVNPGVMDTSMQEAIRNSPLELFPALERFTRLKDDGLLAPPALVARQIAEIVASRPEPGGVYSVNR